jgi:hypothetical protein
LSYPQPTPLPSMKITNLGDPNRKSSALTTEGSEKDAHGKRSILAAVKAGSANGRASRRASRHDPPLRRSSVLRPTGVIDAWYGCDLFDEVVDYALNYTWPWSAFKFHNNNYLPTHVDIQAKVTSSMHSMSQMRLIQTRLLVLKVSSIVRPSRTWKCAFFVDITHR